MSNQIFTRKSLVVGKCCFDDGADSTFGGGSKGLGSVMSFNFNFDTFAFYDFYRIFQDNEMPKHVFTFDIEI